MYGTVKGAQLILQSVVDNRESVNYRNDHNVTKTNDDIGTEEVKMWLVMLSLLHWNTFYTNKKLNTIKDDENFNRDHMYS